MHILFVLCDANFSEDSEYKERWIFIKTLKRFHYLCVNKRKLLLAFLHAWTDKSKIKDTLNECFFFHVLTNREFLSLVQFDLKQ